MTTATVFPELDHQASMKALETRHLRIHLDEAGERTLVTSPDDDTIFQRLCGVISAVTVVISIPALIFSEMSMPLIVAVFMFLMLACGALAPPRYESAYLAEDFHHLLAAHEPAQEPPVTETVPVRTALRTEWWKGDNYSDIVIWKYSASETKALLAVARAHFEPA